MRKILILLVLAGLLAAGIACAEGPESPSTPTDLCPHEHTREVYYFDHPEYAPLNDFTHSITGSATKVLLCDDCGEILRSEQTDDGELVRPHSFKRGICVLCGRPEPQLAPPAEEEMTVETLDAEELLPPEVNAGIPIEIRTRDTAAALVFPTGDFRAEMEKNGEKLTVSLYEAEDRVFTRVMLGDAPVPAKGIQLRIYGRKIESVYFAAENSRTTQIQEAEWTEPAGDRDGYSSVPWLGNGYYKYLEE